MQCFPYFLHPKLSDILVSTIIYLLNGPKGLFLKLSLLLLLYQYWYRSFLDNIIIILMYHAYRGTLFIFLLHICSGFRVCLTFRKTVYCSGRQLPVHGTGKGGLLLFAEKSVSWCPQNFLSASKEFI